MRSLFISHNSADNVKTRELVDWLRSSGFEALFVDFDPACGIPPGRDWERELYAQLRRSDAVIYVASPASAASRWCFAELSLARSLQKPIFPVLVAGTERLALLANVQWVDSADGEEAYAKLLTGLRRAGLDPADAFAWDPNRSPYPGLEPFGAQDAAVFFGRDTEIDRLLQLLQPTLQYADGRFAGIVGPSGSGKSSLLRAGVLPRLQRLPERWIVLPALQPGQDPLNSLARSLAQAFGARGKSLSPVELAERLERGPAELVKLARELAETGPGNPKVLVVIDQAEELVTRTGPHEQQRFLGLLDAALNDASPVWVTATLRSEFLSTAPERAGLAEALDDTLLVEPLTRNRLAEVIARPAQQAGLEFAPGLVERMVEETTGGDALPLLAYTLRELYERVGRDATIGIADYEAIGGVVGALRRRADQVLDELGRRGQSQLILPTLLKLATVEGEGEPSRRRIRLNALPPDEQAVAQAFVDARLLTTDNEDHEATVGVTHEALLRQWAPLRDAIENSRASLRLRSELEREAADWEHGSRDEAYLLRGGRLATFEEWATSHGDELTSLEREFLQASRALTSKELEVARRSNRRLRQLIGGLAAFLVIVIVLGLMAWQQRRVALDQQQLATSRYLATQAETRLDSNPRLSMLLTIQAAKIKNTDEARSSLLSQMAHRQGFRGFLSAHDGVATFQDGVTSVAFSNDGQMLAAGSIDGSVALWDVPNNTQLATLTGQTGPVMDVALSSDGQTLASATPGGVGLWDVRRRSLLATLIGHKGEVHGVAFSPDGQKMASSSDDETVVLWDVARRSRLATLTDHTESVWGVAFSPDGSLLASGSDDKTVMLWDVASKKRLTSLTGHQTVVYRVAFSPDGQALASGSGDGTVNLWDLGDRIATLASHSDQVMGLAFSPDGRTLASGSLDGTVGLWDASQVALISPDGGVPSVAFRPDGRVLAAGSGDGPVGLWDVSRRTRLATLIGHRDEAGAVAFSPDGRMLASGSADDTIGLWDVASRSRLAILTVPSGVAPSTSYISHLAFSHDGRLLASANWNGTIGLWNVSTRSRLATLTSTNVNRVAFSPDGRVLAQCHVA